MLLPVQPSVIIIKRWHNKGVGKTKTLAEYSPKECPFVPSYAGVTRIGSQRRRKQRNRGKKRGVGPRGGSDRVR